MMAETKRVRICVVIDPEGKWEAAGSHSWTDGQAIRELDDLSGDLGPAPWAYHWIEADVPVPVERSDDVIEGKVTDAR